jgi:hypothetical protein
LIGLVGLIRKGMDVKEHERLSNITLWHKCVRLRHVSLITGKYNPVSNVFKFIIYVSLTVFPDKIKALFHYFNLCHSVMLDNLSCSFTSIPFLIKPTSPIDFENNIRYANFTTFSVGDSSTKYRLTISGYSGDAGN